MPLFNVTVGITGQVSYMLEADNQESAERKALRWAEASREMGTVNRQILDVRQPSKTESKTV